MILPLFVGPRSVSYRWLTSVAGHAICPGFTGPRAQDAQAYLALNVKVWVYSSACILDESDNGRNLFKTIGKFYSRNVYRINYHAHHRIPRWDLKPELDKLVLVQGVCRPQHVSIEIQHVLVIELNKVVLVLLLHRRALLRHALGCKAGGHGDQMFWGDHT